MTTRAKLLPTLKRSDQELRKRFSSLASLADVADLLEVPTQVLVYILYRTRARTEYRTFNIPKRSGGLRNIAAPAARLRILQSKLNSVLQAVYRGRSSVHGFVRRRSILSNAGRHTRKNFVLNVDLEDFFPSINFGRVRGVFMGKPYEVEPAAATVLAQICCYEEELPQGAPTSPMVSNLICAKLDSELQRLARQHKCTYTRYADDLTFSTNLKSFPEQLATPQTHLWGSGEDLVLGEELVSVIESNGFEVNPKKQRLQNSQGHQEVTGLTVNEFPNVSRHRVRQLRAMLYSWERFGYEAAERVYHEKYDRRARNPEFAPASFALVLRGKLEYIGWVKGEGSPVYRRLRSRLHRLDPDLVSELPEPPPDDPEKRWLFWYEQYKASVFHVEVRKGGKTNGGTAFAHRANAELVTAAHLLDGEILIRPPDEGLAPASTAAHPQADRHFDVGKMLMPQEFGLPARHIPVRDGPIRPGEPVAALGFPKIEYYDADLALHVGIVESVAKRHGGPKTIQVDILTAGGMSGGPLIDLDGKLVGVNMEQTFEKASKDVPRRAFRHFLPARHILEIGSFTANAE